MRLWFEFLDSFDIKWEVYICKNDNPYLQEASGYTDPETNKIYINEDGDLKKILVLLFHEIEHVSLSAPGDARVLSKIFGAKEDKLDEKEDLLVSFQAPRLFSILHKNGFLKLPEVPKCQ